MEDTESNGGAAPAVGKQAWLRGGVLGVLERTMRILDEWELTVMLWLRKRRSANVLPVLVCAPFLAYNGVRWVAGRCAMGEGGVMPAGAMQGCTQRKKVGGMGGQRVYEGAWRAWGHEAKQFGSTLRVVLSLKPLPFIINLLFNRSFGKSIENSRCFCIGKWLGHNHCPGVQPLSHPQEPHCQRSNCQSRSAYFHVRATTKVESL